jgi:thiol-disulfide isomerase/thioredoxin
MCAMRITRVPLVVVLALALLAIAAASPAARAGVKEGDHYVELDGAKTAQGKTFKLSVMAGKWVLYSFSAKWCQPCHKELPALDKIAPKFAHKVLFVAVNINNDEADAKEFFAGLKLRHIFPVHVAEDSAGLTAYDPDRMPSTFVIDPSGTVRLVHFGFEKGDENALAAKLNALVK